MSSRREAVGLAITLDRVTARRLDGSDAEALAFSRPWSAASVNRQETLSEILRELASIVDGVRTLHISLLPPLAELRLLALPPLDSERLEGAIASDVRRYFPVDATAQVVQVSPASSQRELAASRRVCIVDESLAEDIVSAAASCGLEVASLAAAAYSWASAVHALHESSGTREVWVWTESRVDELTVGPSGVMALRRRPIQAGSPMPPSPALATSIEEAAALAARFAAVPDTASLWPPSIHTKRVQRVLRNARRTALLALLAVLGAASIEWTTTARDEQAVLDARAAHRALVTRASVSRDSLNRLLTTVGVLRGFETEQPDILGVLVALDSVLPRDASIVALDVAADTVRVVGLGRRAAPVLDALTRSTSFRSAWIAAPIQQDVENGEVIAERFVIALMPRGREIP
jgi:hypothetical protein